MAITLATYRRWQMPPEARDCIFACCLHEHELARVLIHAFVVMPDHVHLLLTPLRGQANELFSLPEIMAGIKDASAHAVNHALDRRGKVWEKEYFDHIVRKGNMDAKFDYVVQNPVAMRLVQDPADYPWLWTNTDY